MIISTETAGLGNRLKSWASAMRLGADVRVHWELNDTMPASFADLFANDCGIDSIPADANEYQSWRFAILPEDVAHLPAGFATVGAGAHPLIRGAGKAWWTLTGRRPSTTPMASIKRTPVKIRLKSDEISLNKKYSMLRVASSSKTAPRNHCSRSFSS